MDYSENDDNADGGDNVNVFSSYESRVFLFFMQPIPYIEPLQR